MHAYPWGCPAYVLDPRRQDGQKIPKWQPQSRQAQYLGASPLHASTVGLVRNLCTGNLSPQFHVVYDDFFETVHATPEQAPVEWKELILFQAYRNDLDDDTYVPQLADEWLSPEELHTWQIEQLERREQGDNKLPPQLNLPNQDPDQEALPPDIPPEPPPEPLPESVPPSSPRPAHSPTSTNAEEPLRRAYTGTQCSICHWSSSHLHLLEPENLLP